MVQNKLILSLFAILVLMTNCSLIPCTNDFGLDSLYKTPKLDFIAGDYRLDSNTLKGTQGYDHSQSASLSINENGHFELLNIPQGTIDFDTHYFTGEKKIDIHGTWETEYNSSDITVALEVDFHLDSATSNLNILRNTWKVYRKNEKAVVLIEVGDPDECAAIRFIKQ